MDEVARAIEMDPVELRRRTLIEEGAEGPTRQIFDEVGVRRTLEQAVEMIGYGRDLPDDEAIGVAVGWWPSAPAPSGAYVHINGDGSGTIVTGAQGTAAEPSWRCRSSSPRSWACVRRTSILYQDGGANWDMGRADREPLSAARCAIRPPRIDREQLLDRCRRRRWTGRTRARRPPAGEGLTDRSTIGDRGGRDPGRARAGAGRPDRRHRWLRGRWTQRDVRRRPHHPRAREVDRSTGVVRAEGGGGPRLGRDPEPQGADGQVMGGVVMGVGLALAKARSSMPKDANATRRCSTTSS